MGSTVEALAQIAAALVFSLGFGLLVYVLWSD